LKKEEKEVKVERRKMKTDLNNHQHINKKKNPINHHQAVVVVMINLK